MWWKLERETKRKKEGKREDDDDVGEESKQSFGAEEWIGATGK